MKNYELNHRVVAITGATGGLGRALAQALRAKGAKLVLMDLDLSAVTDQAQELGGTNFALGLQADVCVLESIEMALDTAKQHFGGIDIVIANAGLGVVAPMVTMDARTFEKTIDVNLNGVWRTFKAALPHVASTQGYLMAISSMAAFVHAPLNAHYVASKAGVWAMCDSLRLELEHLGIGVGVCIRHFFKHQ